MAASASPALKTGLLAAAAAAGLGAVYYLNAQRKAAKAAAVKDATPPTVAADAKAAVGAGAGAAASVKPLNAALPAVHDFDSIPVIDISPLFAPRPGHGSTAAQDAARARVAAELFHACRTVGFFYVKNHSVPKALVDRLFSEGTRFFSLPVQEKSRIHMRQSDCFRGYFALGEELTSKKKDWKEGLYFGADEADDHPDVRAKLPMHGPNLYPDEQSFPGFGRLIQDYMAACTELGHTIMEGVAIGLGLPYDYFRQQFTAEPFTPFRLFWYPTDVSPSEQEALAAQSGAGAGAKAEGAAAADTKAVATADAAADAKSDAKPAAAAATGDGKWGVGEHTDYGVLTILAQDSIGGLEVKNCRGEWVQAPPIADTFVINIGDMLQIWTNGLFPATPHRVVKSNKANRLSAPFFFDPNFKCTISPLQLQGVAAPAPGKAPAKPILYGDYILKKVEANFAQMKKGLPRSNY